MVARDRILSARGLDTIIRDMRDTEGAMASADDETRDKAMSRYTRLEEQFTARGGYAAESEAAAIASALALDDRVLGQSLATLSGGPVSYTHLRAHETDSYLVCRLLLEKKKKDKGKKL